MRKATGVLVLLVLVSVFFGVKSQHKATAGETKSDSSEVIVTKIYIVNDLPVWTAEKEFNPTVLMRLIQGTVSPSDWAADGGVSTLTAYPQKFALVISSQNRNHDSIEDLLRSMRPERDRLTEPAATGFSKDG